jgi:hypothetical protein
MFCRLSRDTEPSDRASCREAVAGNVDCGDDSELMARVGRRVGWLGPDNLDMAFTF